MATVAEICENTKMGREYALLGNYDTALVYYQGVIQQIQKMMVQMKDPARRQKWQQVIKSNMFTVQCYSCMVTQGCQ